MPKASSPRAVDLQLEVERVSLLYQQNIQGLLALFALASAYLAFSWSITDAMFLYLWAAALLLSSVGRIILTANWNRHRGTIATPDGCRRWERALQMLIFVSGCAWGAIGWKMPYEPLGVQLVTTVVITTMVGGALAAYPSSYLTMLLVCVPALSIWSVSLLIAGGPIFQTMAGALLFMLFLTTFSGRNLNRYILRGLHLNIENSRLTERLESKVYSLEKAQEELRRTEAMRREQSELDASNRAKSVLLANASHEIRTPLAAINGFADMLLQNQSLSDEVQSDLRMILRNGKYLVSLVNDLLDLSKIENGQIYIQKSAISPLLDIQDVVALMRSSIEGKGLKFEVTIGQLPSRIQTDSTRLREILINMLTNAAKFTDHGTVALTASFDEVTALMHVMVRDTGIGVSVEESKGLFRPFTRGESARVQKVPGSGLGLALSRRLARLLGGELSLVSSRIDRGSEFELTIDAGPGAVRDFRRSLTEAPAASIIQSARMLEKRLSGRNILVVDDSSDLQILMRRFLEKQGAHVDVRENGQEAVETTRDQAYDLVLMDIKMPVLDGYAATKTIRSQGYTAPIVAVTAHASTDDRQRCYLSGFDSYVSKPVDFDHLVDDLSRFLH